MEEQRLTELISDVKSIQKEQAALQAQVLAVAAEVHAFNAIMVEIKNDNKESHKRFWSEHEKDLDKLKNVLEEKIKNGDLTNKIWALIGVVGLLVNIVFQLWKR